MTTATIPPVIMDRHPLQLRAGPPERNGSQWHHVTSDYVTVGYGPILGPTALTLLRFAVTAAPKPASLDELARTLGIASTRRLGPKHPMIRTLDRLARFRLATWIQRPPFPNTTGVEPAVLSLPTHLPALTPAHLDRHSPDVQDYLQRHNSLPTPNPYRQDAP